MGKWEGGGVLEEGAVRPGGIRAGAAEMAGDLR